jgi:predicted nucleotidyltransferase
MVIAPTIPIDQSALRDFCKHHHIRKMSIFGSALRADFAPDSDIDILVEFEPEHIPGLEFFTMEDELSDLLGREVDLNTPGFLSQYFRDEVMAEANVFYEQE